MGYRGRLIWPFIARIAPLDRAATAADPDGVAGFDSGYDDVFREPRQLPTSGTQEGRDARVEGELVDLPCQIEDAAWDQLRMMRTGASQQFEMLLVFHFEALELRGFVDHMGIATVPKIGDRIVSIHRSVDLSLVEEVPNPPGLFCVEAVPRSHGLSGLHRNLLVCTFRERQTASERT